MRHEMLWVAIIGLVLVGVALAQGLWGIPGYGGPMHGYGYGSGMMDGMMGGGMGMMSVYPAQAQPIPPAEARVRLESFAKRFGSEARLKDFMSFSENYYAQVVDAKGNGLVEILADRYTGNVYLEPGPQHDVEHPPGHGHDARPAFCSCALRQGCRTEAGRTVSQGLPARSQGHGGPGFQRLLHL